MAGRRGDAAVLGRRRRRDRAHLLGAAQGRDGAARRRPPDGRLPNPPLRLLPAGADRLRRPAADRGAARQGLGRADDRPRRRRRPADRPDRRPDRADPARSRRGASAPTSTASARQAIVDRIAKVPATAGEGFRFALGLFAHPSRGGLAVLGAAGFWAANIGDPLGVLPRLRRPRRRSRSSSRASSSAWSPTSSRWRRPGSAPSTPA